MFIKDCHKGNFRGRMAKILKSFPGAIFIMYGEIYLPRPSYCYISVCLVPCVYQCLAYVVWLSLLK